MVMAVPPTGLSCRVWFPDAVRAQVWMCFILRAQVLAAGDRLRQALEGQDAANIDHLRRTRKILNTEYLGGWLENHVSSTHHV